MATKAVTVKLSEQRQDGRLKCYKRHIGKKMFYLSQDREQSARMALALLAKWDELKRNGKGWTPEIIATVLAPFRRAAANPVSAPRAVFLHAAIDDYLAEYKGR